MGGDARMPCDERSLLRCEVLQQRLGCLALPFQDRYDIAVHSDPAVPRQYPEQRCKKAVEFRADPKPLAQAGLGVALARLRQHALTMKDARQVALHQTCPAL